MRRFGAFADAFLVGRFVEEPVAAFLRDEV